MIPRNPNSIENGMTDPTPEKGKKGSFWRALVSWLKGWGPEPKPQTPPNREGE